MKKKLALCLAFLLFVLFAQTSWAASLTIVASESQQADMSLFLSDMKDNGVDVTLVSPDQVASVKNADYLILVAEEGDLAWKEISGFVADSVREGIGEAGYGKYILLRDIWKKGQEVIVFAAHDESAATAVRKKAKNKWWPTVASWYEINVVLVPNY